jgi:haloacetate dehalogenase
MAGPLLDSFTAHDVTVDGIDIHCEVAGDGPPVLMLHGYPQTHVMWHRVAPMLAVDHTVVLADLRGYGDSGKPEPDAGNETYAKRAMAHDQVALMAHLGFDRFALIGHDRGARVAHRLALDSPDAVERLAVLDIVPTRHVYGTVDRAMATAYFHWFFLPLPGGIPERLIGNDPEFWLRSATTGLLRTGNVLDPAAVSEYVRCFSDPRAVAATCADYRAAATTDLTHDEASFAAGDRIECPTLALWGDEGFVGRHYDVLDVWRRYTTDVRGVAVPSGHFVAEEAPDETLSALRAFLRQKY